MGALFSRAMARQPMSVRQKPPGQSILRDRLVGARLRFGDGLAARRDVEHAAAGGEQTVALPPRAGMEDLDALHGARRSSPRISVPLA